MYPVYVHTFCMVSHISGECDVLPSSEWYTAVIMKFLRMRAIFKPFVGGDAIICPVWWGLESAETLQLSSIYIYYAHILGFYCFQVRSAITHVLDFFFLFKILFRSWAVEKIRVASSTWKWLITYDKLNNGMFAYANTSVEIRRILMLRYTRVDQTTDLLNRTTWALIGWWRVIQLKIVRLHVTTMAIVAPKF